MGKVKNYFKKKSLKYLPKGSIRRLLVKIIYKILIFPIKVILFVINFVFLNRIIKLYYYKNYLEKNVRLINISNHEPIIFKKENNPVVSIIIPVYNQFDYTYNCLKSIYNNSGDEVSFEIIIADDCSDDLTTKINEIISNIIIVRNSENLRFLKNCNNAVKYTNGKYILFLNNDTQVQKNWLSSLVKLIESDETIGAVGSKLLFKNGLMQEAGGIIWNDASAYNYGRNRYPALPEFNYVKEVDYISGASLMIRRNIWEELGGFDENFSPAYYEDVDLCFSVRSMGYKVMYQPQSVVVHFEGITNGTDLSTGQKKYQVVNKEKFFKKWKNILENEHFNNNENIFLARDKSKNKKTILMIDHHVPCFDNYAGARSVFHFLKIFVNLKFNVIFIGDSFLYHKPYTNILEQMGIEVLYGPYYRDKWKTWLEDNGKYIDYAFLNRPDITSKYIDKIIKYSKAKIIYYNVDLHFLRESREYAITKDIKKLKSSEEYKILEFSLMRKANVNYCLSTAELDIIKKIDPSINCKIIPIFIYEKDKLRFFDFENRKNLLFIGGFKHTPNIDALSWFINNIFPIVQEGIPGIILNIIGSNVNNEVMAFQNNNIKIIGYVDDKKLDEYYNNCRISIVPLRYGAGIKGKVIEAMYKQIPVITTSIGSEGLPDIEDCLIIEDNPEQYANKLINMYNDKKLLTLLTEKSFSYVMEHFTFDSLINILREDFDINNSFQIL